MSNPHDHPQPDGRSPEPMPPVQDGAGPIPRPKAVDTAFQASLAGAAVGVVAMVVLVLLDREQLVPLAREFLAEAGLPDGDREVADAVGTVRTIVVLAIAVYLGLWVLFATKMRAGRNWARMVIAVFAVIAVLGFLNAIAGSGAQLGLIWDLAQAAFLVTALVYMFRPESTSYFAAHRERRLARRGGGRPT